MFTEKEQEYLKNNQLARMGTITETGQPDVVPIRYEFDGAAFYVGGQYMIRSRKYRNVEAGNNKVALVIDDFIPVEGGMPGIRGIRIYGLAQPVERPGWGGVMSTQLKITPTTTWSWGIEGPAFTEAGFVTHKTQWKQA